MKRIIYLAIYLAIMAGSAWGTVETGKPSASSDDWNGAANANATFTGAWLGGANPDSTTQLLYLGMTGAWFYAKSTRFTAIDIPQGSTIDSVEYWVKSGANSSDSFIVAIAAYDADNGVQVVDTSGFRSAWASATTARDTAWISTTTSWVAGTKYKLPYAHTKTVLQEIIDRAGWTSGNNITMMTIGVSGSPSNRATRGMDFPTAGTSYDSLWISYTAGGGGSPSATPNVVIRSATLHTTTLRAPEKLFYRQKDNWRW